MPVSGKGEAPQVQMDSIEGWLDELCQHGLLAVFELVKVLQLVQCYQGSNTLLVNCNLYLHKVFDKS
jgi:hypothetical protein